MRRLAVSSGHDCFCHRRILAISKHYEVLGVAETASPDEVRAAYRRLMRVVHPDVASSGNGTGLHSAADVNEAYRVLIDPERRLAYDRQRRVSGSAIPPTQQPQYRYESSDHPVYQRPVSRPSSPDRRVPWRGVLAVVLSGVVGVVVLSAVADPSVPRSPDGVLQSGSCVTIEPNGDAREIACTGVDDIVMDVLVPFDIPCPQGTVGHRDRQGMGVACIAPLPTVVSP